MITPDPAVLQTLLILNRTLGESKAKEVGIGNVDGSLR